MHTRGTVPPTGVEVTGFDVEVGGDGGIEVLVGGFTELLTGVGGVGGGGAEPDL